MLDTGAEATFAPSGHPWLDLGLVNEYAQAVVVLDPRLFAAYQVLASNREKPPPFCAASRRRTRRRSSSRLRGGAAGAPTRSSRHAIGLDLRPGASKHLRSAASRGCVDGRRDGDYRLYSLSRDRIAPLSAMLLDFVDGVADEDGSPDL